MTTKGFIVFIAGDEDKNSYNHLDSGPRELGIKLLHWLRDESRRPDKLRAAITRLQAVSDEDGPPPTPEEVSRLQDCSDPTAGDPAEEWCALLGRTQSDPDAILASGYIGMRMTHLDGSTKSTPMSRHSQSGLTAAIALGLIIATARRGHGRLCLQTSGSSPRRSR